MGVATHSKFYSKIEGKVKFFASPSLTVGAMKAAHSVPTQLHHSVLWLYRLCLISGRSLTITVPELLQVKSFQGRTVCETLTHVY